MQHQSDAQLLLRYARQSSEVAFGEIVARHADLVYSAGLRQVDSPDLARDVAQTVFIDLARKARSLVEKLPPDASLVGWLYRSTRFAALNVVRVDQRRQARERQAMDHLDTMNPTPETALNWEQVRPLLDEAISTLGDEDRDALLLRFFKNQDFRAVGLALGVSDDAAQKRVSRALEKLRDLLARRGITTTTAALSFAISANAVEAVPVGLVAALSNAAIAATAIPPTAIAATKLIAMTTIQKTFIGAALVAAIGTGIHEARRASRLSEQLQALQQQRITLADQVQQLTRERDGALGEVALFREESQRTRRGPQASAPPGISDSGDPTEIAVKSWLKRINQLKQRLEDTPQAKIPELQFLKNLDWVEVAANTKLETDTDYRKAMADIRKRGEDYFVEKLHAALGKYMQANNGEWPDDVSQLDTYFDPPVERAIWERWEIVPATAFPGREFASGRVITEKSAFDPEFDSRHTIDGQYSGGVGPYHPYGYEESPSDDLTSVLGDKPARVVTSAEVVKPTGEMLALKETLEPVFQAYRSANGGNEPRSASDLQPYATNSAQQSALQKISEIINQPNR